MQRALSLARRGHGRVSPNPMVGAVVVSEGHVVGAGYHRYAQRSHAEVLALDEAGTAARGADLYVTLEPCCHWGRTPPCAEKIVRSGIRRVFVAVVDPNPEVSGGGIEYLRAQGVEVQVGLCEREATRLNEIFFHFVRTGRPYVLLKLALSLDGRLATATGDSKWITGTESRKLVHRLRFDSDAILIGRQTAVQDDPSLAVRGRSRNSITKVILDSDLKLSPAAKLFESGDPVVIFHRQDVDIERIKALSATATLIQVGERAGRLDWNEILERLAERSITSVMVEGGGEIAGTLLRGGLVDRLYLFYGPAIIGDQGVPGFADLKLSLLSDAPRIEILRLRRLGSDFLVEGRIPQR